MSAHADFSVDKLSGPEKWRDMCTSKIDCLCTGELVRTHESHQRRQLIGGTENFLAAPELLQSYNLFAGKSDCNMLQ